MMVKNMEVEDSHKNNHMNSGNRYHNCTDNDNRYAKGSGKVWDWLVGRIGNSI